MDEEEVVTTVEESDEEYDVIALADLEGRTVKIGRQGENLTQQVQIDCSEWADDYGDYELTIYAVRPGENEIYIPSGVTVEDSVITWVIHSADTANAGIGRAEVRAVKDDAIKKGPVFRTEVQPSLEGGGSVVPDIPSWAQEILDAVTVSADSAAAAATSASTAAASSATAVEQVEALADDIEELQADLDTKIHELTTYIDMFRTIIEAQERNLEYQESVLQEEIDAMAGEENS